MYWGRAGLGAFCRRQNAPQQPIAVSRCNKNAHEPCRVIVSRSNLNAETQTFINRLGVTELVPMGSSLKFCHIAEGGADIYHRLGPTCEWDTAAVQAVLEGAGGAVVEVCGRQPLRYGKAETLNPFSLQRAM